ncbi:hypothetical protein ACVALR_14050 [Stenotrophomonas maltophilia]
MDMTFRTHGEANTYTLTQGDQWIAALRFNGELLPITQEHIVQAFAMALDNPLTDRQACAAILAGLRLLQRQDVLPADVDDVLTDGGQIDRITECDIDRICERIGMPQIEISASVLGS